mmetsp:Transcript_1938/g.5809  ORF Transcript_1938/g.5809 Transcript_1938/m.5809 type:complete len:217 (-) Transcript_1938:773-1423(-)
MVLFWSVAVCDGGLAQRGRGRFRPRALLPCVVPRDGLRHFVLLGGSNGHDGRGVYGQGAVRDDLHARPRARCHWGQDVQDQGQRHRPVGRRGRVRRRRVALHLGDGCDARPGRAPLDGKSRAEPQLCQQTVERRTLRRHARPARRRRPALPARRRRIGVAAHAGAVDREQGARDGKGRHRLPRGLRHRRRGPPDLRVYLGRVCRLVHRVVQDAPGR